jgi:hypothetical protein
MKIFAGSAWSGWMRIEGTTDVSLAATAYQGRLYLFGKGINDKGVYVNVLG